MSQSTKHPNHQNELSILQETLSNGYEYTKIINNNQSSKRRKLILHFDNRRFIPSFLVKQGDWKKWKELVVLVENDFNLIRSQKNRS